MKRPAEWFSSFPPGHPLSKRGNGGAFLGFNGSQWDLIGPTMAGDGKHTTLYGDFGDGL